MTDELDLEIPDFLRRSAEETTPEPANPGAEAAPEPVTPAGNRRVDRTISRKFLMGEITHDEFLLLQDEPPEQGLCGNGAGPDEGAQQG